MSLLTIRMQITIQTVLVLCVLACSVQTFAQALPGIGTVNHLAVDVIKVTTNPTDPKDTADINGPVGGDSVSIYVKVQYGNVITSINSVTVNIHEFGVSTVVGSLSLTTYTQLADSGSGEATLHTRVYTGTWNTLTTTPLIYNANYCFKATVDYDRNNAHASPAVDSEEVIVPVKNLWVTDIDSQFAPEPFLLVSPGGTQNIVVNFEHYKTTADYQVLVTIRETPNPTSIVATLDSGIIHTKSATLSWSPSTDETTGWPYGGYFCFDVEVKEGVDSVKYCSTACTIALDDLTNDGNYSYFYLCSFRSA